MAQKKYKSTKDKKKEIEQLTEDRNKEVERFFTTPEQLQEYLDFMSRFYNYSFRNSTLIKKQYPGAQALGSFKFWKDKGFSVQKGEKGIKILVPYEYRTFEREKENGTVNTPVKYATKQEKAEIEKGNIPVKENLAYTTGHVFDVSQTSATLDDLPEIFPNKWLEGEVKNYREIFQSLERLASQMDVKVLEEPMRELGAAKGAYIEYQQRNQLGDLENKKVIELNPRNSELNNIKTLIHELAHTKLHNSSTEHSKKLNHNEKEFQAEMTAYTVSSHFNIDTSDYSLNYLHNYTKDHQQINDKIQLLEEAKSTSYEFITHLENDLVKEKEFHQEYVSKAEMTDIHLQEKYGDIHVITEEKITLVGDLTLNDFQNLFYDKHNRNILNQNDLQGLDKQELVQAFNALDDNWNIRSQNTKMIDPKMDQAYAYVVWSETDLNHSLMNVVNMDRELAKANLDSFKGTGYDKTKINFVIPNKDGISVKTADRIDLGDGVFSHLHDYLKSSQPDLAKHTPQEKDHLSDIYSKSVVSITVENIYKENVYLKHEHNQDDSRVKVSNINVEAIEEFSLNNDILSKNELIEIESKVTESFHEEYEYMKITNQMVNLKGYYEKCHQLLREENTGELRKKN